jgi:hypothetical protein
MVAELKLTEKWLDRRLSTYDYLILLNLLGGRSFNDLSQYPVFPWVISDYESDTLKLDRPETYRDFTKPIGALNETRLRKLRREFTEAPDPAGLCLYRGHYSTPYYVLHYMIRLEPFTTMHITMQTGKFDHPNRLFASVPRQWAVITSTTNDYRELIPEFFALPDFLTNSDNFDLGLSDSNVELPKWASSAADFISKHRQALESDYVGHQIQHWIDLVFGYQQTGRAAQEADNLFHPHSYPSALTKGALSNPESLSEIQNHAGSFGIIPRQLFTTPHPPRGQQRPHSKNLVFALFSRTAAEVFHVESRRQQIFVLTADGVFHRFRRSSVESEYRIPAGFGVGRKFVLFPSLNIAVITSPSGDSFHFFTLDAALAHIRSFRQQFSGLQALASGGHRILVVLNHDGSLAAWSAVTHERLFRVNHHLAPATDAAASEGLRMIASVDESARVVFVELWNGAFIRSFTLVECGLRATRVLLIDDGFLAVLCEGRRGPEPRTIVQFYGMNAQLVGAFERAGAVVCWCVANRIDAPALIAVAFDDGTLVIVTVPDGKAATSARFPAPLKAIAYDVYDNTLYLADAGQQILCASIEC